jgi:hypothetical protein
VYFKKFKLKQLFTKGFWSLVSHLILTRMIKGNYIQDKGNIIFEFTNRKPKENETLIARLFWQNCICRIK